MTIGFRIRDANTNQIVVDLTDRLSRVTYTGSTVANTAGSILIPDSNDGEPFFVCPFMVYLFSSGRAPDFSLNASTGVLSWTAAPLAVPFFAGVF